MLTYHHTKEKLAAAVARNLSMIQNDAVYAYVGSMKSVPTMKFVDTTVCRVAKHVELPISGVNIIFGAYRKGKELKADFTQNYRSIKPKK